MQDIGSLPWVKDVLDVVAWVATETKQKLKLRARVTEAVAEYNKSISRTDSGARRNLEIPTATRTSTEELLAPLPPTAIMLKKPARTRFASIESTLEAYIRTRVVLLGVVQSPDFFRNLWDASKQSERTKRDKFISTIESRSFLTKVEDLHKVFRLLRRYLRAFDSDDSKISDVVPKTISVGLDLENVPVTPFLTQHRKTEVLTKFYKRRDGPLSGSIKVRLLEDIHFAAHLLDPCHSPRNVRPFIRRFRSFVAWYCAGGQTDSSEDSTSQDLRKKLLVQFVELSGVWTDLKDDAGSNEIFNDFEDMPLLYWTSYVDSAKYGELIEFAQRTLYVSPSPCAAERSFSMQDHIRTKHRNRLHTEKVKKLAFSHCNMKLLNDQSFSQQGFFRSVYSREEQDAGIGDEDDEDDNEDHAGLDNDYAEQHLPRGGLFSEGEGHTGNLTEESEDLQTEVRIIQNTSTLTHPRRPVPLIQFE